MPTDSITSNLRQLPEVENPLRLFQLLSADLEKLKSQLRNQQKGKIASKVLSGLSLSSGNLPDGKELELSGSRLSKKLENKHAQELSTTLHRHPEDSNARLELIGLFVQVSGQFELDAARDAYSLALLEAEDPLLSTRKINAAVVAQNIYLKKLHGFLNSDFASAKEKMESGAEGDAVLQEQVKKCKAESALSEAVSLC